MLPPLIISDLNSCFPGGKHLRYAKCSDYNFDFTVFIEEMRRRLIDPLSCKSCETFSIGASAAFWIISNQYSVS